MCQKSARGQLKVSIICICRKKKQVPCSWHINSGLFWRSNELPRRDLRRLCTNVWGSGSKSTELSHFSLKIFHRKTNLVPKNILAIIGGIRTKFQILCAAIHLIHALFRPLMDDDSSSSLYGLALISKIDANGAKTMPLIFAHIFDARDRTEPRIIA